MGLERHRATTLEDLLAIEAKHERTSVLYTFPIRFSAIAPGVWNCLNREQAEEASFTGTVGGGSVIIKVRQ